jgi:hypothetical protein
VQSVRRIVLTPGDRDLPEGMSASAFHEALADAASAWSATPCGVTISVGEPASRWSATEDGLSLVAFRAREWCHNERCGPTSTFHPRALAMTTKYPKGASGAELREADIELRASAFRSSSSSAQTAGRAPSLKTVLVHEIGHVLGIKDACVDGHRISGEPVIGDCSPEARDSVMFAPSRLDAPSESDIATLCSLYPPEPRAVTSSGLSSAQAFAGALALAGVVLIAAVTRKAARRRSCRP